MSNVLWYAGEILVMYDIWNQEIDIVNEIYKQKNYYIKRNESIHNNRCYIFFSSNNIWYPNTEEAFKKSFIDNDYYEWKKYSNLPAEKIIFVRDIYKSWYVTGINNELNSIDSVINFLRVETSNMEVITVGSSAGGYMAALVASILNAKYSICFSAQFDLTSEGALNVNPLLKKYVTDKSRRKYYQITEFIKKSNTKIYYIMPVFVKSDLQQMEKVLGIKNINILRMKSHRHGVPILKGCILTLLQMKELELEYLFQERDGKKIGIINLAILLCGVRKTIRYICDEAIYQIKRKLRN